MAMIRPGEVGLKSDTVLLGFINHRWQAQLKDIILDLIRAYGLYITESYRKKRHAHDLHGADPVRAVDIRTWCYPAGTDEAIREYINLKWEYDRDRPKMNVAVLHDAGNGVHLHIQTHPNTRRRLR